MVTVLQDGCTSFTEKVEKLVLHTWRTICFWKHTETVAKNRKKTHISQIRQWLLAKDSYTLHTRKLLRRKTVAKGFGEQRQADQVDVSNVAVPMDVLFSQQLMYLPAEALPQRFRTNRKSSCAEAGSGATRKWSAATVDRQRQIVLQQTRFSCS